MINKTPFLILLSLVGFYSSWSWSQTNVEYNKKIDPAKKYYVIIMGGQSNMRGQGKKVDLDAENFENITFLNFGLTPSLKVDNKSFGPEIGVSKVLKENYPNKNFILIKYAIGGSSMLDWSPEYDPEKAKITGHPEYGNMYKTLLQKIDSITQGLDTEMVALLWAQGAADARVPKAGKAYYKNFKNFINSFRKDLHEPMLPVIFGITNPPKSKYPAVEKVRLAQKRIEKNIPNTYLIETDDLAKRSDNLHFSSNGQLEFGRRFGNELRKWIDK